MYADYWSLRDNPFLNTTDSRYLFSAGQYEEAIARFTFMAKNGRQAGMLTGLPGTGKSTVLEHVAMSGMQQRLKVIRMDAIPGGELPMVNHILGQMKLKNTWATLPDALMALAQATESQSERLVRTLLCLDEAHYLVEESGLYLVHYLSNLRITNRSACRNQPLFTMILAGNPAFAQSVGDYPSLRQRMQIVFELRPLSELETSAYIQHHMRAAGGDLWVYEQTALEALFHFSQGIPRKINLLCDTSLMLGFAARVSQITRAIVLQAAEDTGLADRYSVQASEEQQDVGTV